MPECADAIEFWGTIPANDENGLRVQAITVRIVTLNFGWSCPPAKSVTPITILIKSPAPAIRTVNLGGKDATLDRIT